MAWISIFERSVLDTVIKLVAVAPAPTELCSFRKKAIKW
jgi:hypothetical protein